MMRVCALLSLFLGALPALAQDHKVTLKAEAPRSIQVGKQFDLVVKLSIPAGFHIQAYDAKDPFIPSAISVICDGSVKVGKPKFPVATVFDTAGEKVRGHDGSVRVTIPVTINKPGKAVELKVKLNYQACNESTCYPPAAADGSVRVEVSGK